jgi:hypothetical protein
MCCRHALTITANKDKDKNTSNLPEQHKHSDMDCEIGNDAIGDCGTDHVGGYLHSSD